MVELAAVLLAGGEARRFPGKLEYRLAGEPILAHTYRRLRECGWPVYIAGKASFEPALDAFLDAPMLVDRNPGEGPLRAFVGACAEIRAERVFAIAADLPALRVSLLQQLARQWQAGDEAAVPQHGGRVEPLAALYSRRALLRESGALRRHGARAMRDALARLQTRYVPCDSKDFHNVNRPEDVTSLENEA
jgi:molybdenum cofactor guanylyltransferase